MMPSLDEIQLHDAVIKRVIELPDQDELHFEIEYCVDWDRSRFEPRVLVFRDVLNYSIDEGPFYGSPAILTVKHGEQVGERHQIVLETNAGTRSFFAASAELRSHSG